MGVLTSVFRTREVSTERDHERFESLMRATSRHAYNLAYRLTGNTAEAEDLVQETYVRAFRFFHRYDDTLPFSSWIYRIMSNAHIDMVRRKSRFKTTSIDRASDEGQGAWEFPDESQSPDRALESEGLPDAMELALKSMSPEFRSAVLMADVQGMAYEEIADTMQISIGTVRSRIHRGRRQLREYLETSFPDYARGGSR